MLFYTLTTLITSILSIYVKYVYCHYKYNESIFSCKNINVSLIREMFSFSLWNSIGAFAIVCRTQGIALVINIYYGLIANAAYGIANQISNQLINISSYLQKSMNPRIMKSEGGGNHNEMVTTSLIQCKYTFILLLIVGLPLYVAMPYILKLWLKDVPEYSVIFSRLMIIVALIRQITSGLQVAIQATGKIFQYQIGISIIILCTIPLAFLFFELKFPCYSAIISMILIEIICLILRPFYAKKYAAVPIISFITKVLTPCMIISIVSICSVYLVTALFNLESGLLQLFILVLFSFFVISAITIVVSDTNEKIFIKSVFFKVLRHVH